MKKSNERNYYDCDVFHMQVMHGNLLQNILSNTDIPGFGTAEELYKKYGYDLNSVMEYVESLF